MDKIREVFHGFSEITRSPIIKTCGFSELDRARHKAGLLNILRYHEGSFVLDAEVKPVLNLLFDYFTGYHSAELDLSKGIMLIGSVGTGKSLLFRAFKDYTNIILRKNSYIVHDVKSIVANVNVHGLDSVNDVNYRDGKPTVIYIDDIASTNETVKHYGTEINAMETLLSLRYDIYIRYNKLTHITTNKTPKELKDLYGLRVADRMKEMFNIVVLNTKSYRK